jgi:hypothetical protein
MMTQQYEVLSPWAEIDPIPLKGISPRLPDLGGKKIGLFSNDKRASVPVLQVVEKKLKDRFPTLEMSYYARSKAGCIALLNEAERAKIDDWVKGLDGVIAAVGD